MKQEFPRFNMKLPPVRTKWYLRPVTYLLSAPDVKKHGAVITKTGAEDLRPPYVLLGNHNALWTSRLQRKQFIRPARTMSSPLTDLSAGKSSCGMWAAYANVNLQTTLHLYGILSEQFGMETLP